MSVIKNTNTGQTINLLSQHIFGRHKVAVNTVIDNPKASRIHASISWNGEGWILQDLSTNGTFVNQKQIATNIEHPLNLNDTIQFANLSSATWVVEDTSPPYSALIPVTDNTPLITLEKLTALPDENSPTVTIYQASDGQWLCESSNGTAALEDNSNVVVQQQIWQFREAKNAVATERMNNQSYVEPDDIAINFNVSQDEEHVWVTLLFGNQQLDLGERNHHYLLLLLARQTLEDQSSKFAKPEQGWIDKEELSTMLGLTEQHINMQIYRFRTQLNNIDDLPNGLSQLLQRRKGGLRLNCANVNIVGGCS